MKLLPALLALLLLLVLMIEAERERRAHARRKRHVDLSDSSRPLRRSKRRWVLTTIVLDENDPGPFPKHAGDLFNDRADNFSIKYLISGPGVDQPPEIGLFTIDDHLGKVYVTRPIDRERTPLFVVAFDAAERLTGKIVDKSLIFNVEVLDKNDNAPKFSQKVYNITVKETVNLDSPLFHVTATDDDKEDTPNSEVTYSIINFIPKVDNVKFSIDPKNGLIRAEGCFSSEVTSFFRVIVGAKDSGEEPLSSTATLNINIQDGNNNLPVFLSQSYNLTLREGEMKKGILRLKVEDKDTPKTPGWRAKYKVLSGNDNGNYNLTTDPETNEGILDIIKPLDFEGTPTKKVVVAAENEEPYYLCQGGKLKLDKTAVPSNVTLYITVIDSNDAPVFSPQSKIIRSEEGVQPGTVLGTFTANDPDKVPNKIRYTIANDPAGWVTVDPNTGVVTAVKELDRESPFVNKTTYTVLLYAIDDGDPPATGTGTVIINLSDINDNTPELRTPYVERCEQQGDAPFTVEAMDRDLDPYSGPFKFDFSHQSRSVKESWQVKQSSDNSAEVLMLQKLPKGNYSIPMEIYDRQGTYKERVLTVRVCHCPDSLNCEAVEPASYRMGGGAIGAIIGALIFCLVALCLLMTLLCGSGKDKHLSPNDEGNQTLIKYNEEGGSALSQASPAVQIATNGNIHYATKDKEAVSRSLSSNNNTPRSPHWETDGAVGAGIPAIGYRSLTQNGTWGRSGVGAAAAAAVGAGFSRSSSRRTQNGTWTMKSPGAQAYMESYTSGSRYSRNGSLRSRGDGVFVERIGEMLSKRLNSLPDDDDILTDKFRVYAHEGELERFESMESFAFPEENMDFSFLDQFDPKFAKLEQICQQ